MAVDPNSTDIVEPNIMEHYINRPDEIEVWCLADFTAKCQYSKSRRKNVDVDYDNDDDRIDEDEQNEIKWLKLKRIVDLFI